MEQLSIFSATLGLSPPWQVTSVSFEKESNRLDIRVEFTPGCSLTCPVCGRHEHVSAAEEDTEVWYHADFFRYAAYLHARIPQLACACGALPLERPWCRAGSRFARVP
jgi:transposase